MTIACPSCGERARTYDTRAGPRGTWRRRKRCWGCGRIFVTIEAIREADMLKPASLLTRLFPHMANRGAT